MLNSTKGRKERIGKIYQMHANKREEIASRRRRSDRRRDGSEGHHHRRDPVRPGQPGRAGVDGLPGPGDRAGHRAEDQVRPGEAGRRHPAAGRGGPDLPGAHRRRDRSDDHRRHGRAAPRGADRPDEARVPGRGQHRQAAGGVPRDPAPRGGEGRLHPQEAVRWLGSVRQGDHRPGAAGAGLGLRVRQRRHRRSDPQGVHPGGRRGHPGRHAVRRAGRLPGRGHQGDADRTARTTTSTPPSSPSGSPARWSSRRPPGGPTRLCWSR